MQRPLQAILRMAKRGGERQGCALQMYAREKDHLSHFLTYADNNAVGYFAKQGFTKEITLDRDRVGTTCFLSASLPNSAPGLWLPSTPSFLHYDWLRFTLSASPSDLGQDALSDQPLSCPYALGEPCVHLGKVSNTCIPDMGHAFFLM